jgi:hypothetical protein
MKNNTKKIRIKKTVGNMWLKILGLMMQQQGFRSPQSSLTVDTKAVINSPTFPTTGTLPTMRKRKHIYSINNL